MEFFATKKLTLCVVVMLAMLMPVSATHLRLFCFTSSEERCAWTVSEQNILQEDNSLESRIYIGLSIPLNANGTITFFPEEAGNWDATELTVSDSSGVIKEQTLVKKGNSVEIPIDQLRPNGSDTTLTNEQMTIKYSIKNFAKAIDCESSIESLFGCPYTPILEAQFGSQLESWGAPGYEPYFSAQNIKEIVLPPKVNLIDSSSPFSSSYNRERYFTQVPIDAGQWKAGSWTRVSYERASSKNTAELWALVIGLVLGWLLTMFNPKVFFKQLKKWFFEFKQRVKRIK